jgi:hypothetical protein
MQFHSIPRLPGNRPRLSAERRHTILCTGHPASFRRDAEEVSGDLILGHGQSRQLKMPQGRRCASRPKLQKPDRAMRDRVDTHPPVLGIDDGEPRGQKAPPDILRGKGGSLSAAGSQRIVPVSRALHVRDARFVSRMTAKHLRRESNARGGASIRLAGQFV